jgi:DNA (cytosine-5)-methyltransferase 1
MTNLSLCSGYGGLDLAVEQITGNKTLVYAENDKYAAQVMAARFPWATNLGDISKVDWADVAQDYQIDSLSAGFPCRNISNAGKRDGINGQWSKVWKNVAEAVGAFRPRIVFLENVQAILSRGLDVVAQDLAEIGYDARWTCLPAADIGAAHLRRRWFCVAYPAASDPERSGRYRWPGDDAQAQGRPEFANGRHATAGPAGKLSLLPSPVVADSRGTRNHTARRSPGKKFSPGKTLTDVAWLLPAPKASDGPNGGPNQRDAAGNFYLPGVAVRLDEHWVSVDGVDYGPAVRRWENILGRPAPEPTEAGTRGNRRITPPFVEWLMGANEGWFTDPDLDIPRAQQIKIGGNGAMTRQAVEGYRRLLCADLDAMAA